MIPLPPKKQYDLPQIAPEDMTPQIAALVAFIEESLRIRDATYDESVALRKELAQLKRAKRQVRRLQAASEVVLEENYRLWEEVGRLKDGIRCTIR